MSKWIFQKNSGDQQGVNAVISTNERIEFITGHMVYNPANNKILQMKET